jgi:hypothetical protein
MVMISTTIETRRDEETAALMREATAAKNVRDWPRAIDCLQRAKMRMGSGHTIDAWLRLPVFLQQAGRFSEAMAEFAWLVERVNARDQRLIGDGGPYFMQRLMAVCLAHIYDKMRLACKREKLPEQAERYAGMKDEQDDLADKLERLVEKERKAERAAYERKRRDRKERLNKGG